MTAPTAPPPPAVVNGWEVAPGRPGTWWVRRHGGGGALAWCFPDRAAAVAFAQRLRPWDPAVRTPAEQAAERVAVLRLFCRLQALAAREPAKAAVARALARKLAAHLPGSHGPG